ncbi:aminotransferase [Thalassotalea sp. 42_200_T64]|nr:aminotransferase [Thalassotalea sp. 42_200_T64]
MIYLDTAASFPILPEVKATLTDAFDSFYANSASGHRLGTIVSKDINKIREQLADSIGAYPSEIVFTSGATESNNIAFKSLLLGGEIPANKKHIITSQIEHKCIFAICDYLESLGYEITYLKPNQSGIIEPQSVKNALRDDTALVSIMHVNNELGTINPIADIGNVCFEKGVLFHSDAAQSFGKIDIDVDHLNVDVVSFSAHKIGGPKGIGAIYIRDFRKKHLVPVIHGAGQEEGLRGGTVAAPLILGFGKAIEIFPASYKQFKELNIKEYLINQLDINKIYFKINGDDRVLQNCISITLPETNIALLIREHEANFCLAQGSACSSKEIEASHVLTALGLSRELAEKTLRISFPLDISKSQIDELVKAVKKVTRDSRLIDNAYIPGSNVVSYSEELEPAG